MRKETMVKWKDKFGMRYGDWYMDSVKILLFSDDEKLYNSTERIIGKKHQLKWCTYQQLENNRYPTADVVIFHFTKEIIERERAFAAIIKIKGSLGHLTPILAISEGGSIQDIFSILKAGAYDYIETIDNTRKYKKKIENLILWNWYIKKHTSAKKRQCWERTGETLLLFFCLFGKNYINTRFFYKRTEWEIFCSNVLVNKWKEILIMKSKKSASKSISKFISETW